jgi:[amino group carrier protein]-L-2-aminoadipate 6-kinase
LACTLYKNRNLKDESIIHLVLNEKKMTMNSSIIVVKLGGTEGVDFSAICQDAAALLAAGKQLVLVHGGSAEANQLGTALGTPARFITSPSGYTSRYTDRHTLEIFAMAVNGKVNTMLVEQLQRLSVNALGLSGLDGRLLAATRKDTIQSVENGKRKIIRDDYTGKIETVNTALLATLLDGGYTPVIAPIAVSAAGEALNVDADRAAAMVAAALQASTLVLLTAVPGLMRSFPDESSLIHNLPQQKLDEAIAFAEGRMKKKVLGAQEALRGGVCQVIIADGRVKEPVTRALNGSGTIIS